MSAHWWKGEIDRGELIPPEELILLLVYYLFVVVSPQHSIPIDRTDISSLRVTLAVRLTARSVFYCNTINSAHLSRRGVGNMELVWHSDRRLG